MLLLREIKHATDPPLSGVLSKICEGKCDSHVSQVLQARLVQQDMNTVDLNNSDKLLYQSSVTKLTIDALRKS